MAQGAQGLGLVMALTLAVAACTAPPTTGEGETRRTQRIPTASAGPKAPGDPNLPLASGSPLVGTLGSASPSTTGVGASASPAATASATPAASATATPAASATATPAATSTPTPAPTPTPAVAVDTVAGNGTGEGTDTGAFADGSATGAGALSVPVDVAVDPTSPAGTTRLFIADSGNRRVRLLTLSATSATLSTYAGTGELLVGGDSPTGLDSAVGTQAKFYNPFALSVASDGTLYVLDSTFNRSLVRKISPTGTHEVSTLVRGPLVGGTAVGAEFGALDGDANTARFSNPSALCLDAPNNRLVVADRQSQKIRSVDLSSGAVTTLAGSGTQGTANAYALTRIGLFDVLVPQPTGPGLEARFSLPAGVAFKDGRIYTIESFNPRLRLIGDLTGARTVRNLTGPAIDWDPVAQSDVNATAAWGSGFRDGDPLQAKFQPFNGARLAIGPAGLYIADHDNQRIRLATLKADGTLNTVKTIAGSGSVAAVGGQGGGGFSGAFADGPALDGAKFHNPLGLAVAADGTVFVADQLNHRIRRIKPPAGGF